MQTYHVAEFAAEGDLVHSWTVEADGIEEAADEVCRILGRIGKRSTAVDVDAEFAEATISTPCGLCYEVNEQ